MKTELELFCLHPVFAKLHETLRPIRLTLLYICILTRYQRSFKQIFWQFACGNLSDRDYTLLSNFSQS